MVKSEQPTRPKHSIYIKHYKMQQLRRNPVNQNVHQMYNIQCILENGSLCDMLTYNGTTPLAAMKLLKGPFRFTGCLIFSYDLGISGGVASMDSFLEFFFPSVYKKEKADDSTNQYCKFDSKILTLFTSSLYLEAIMSSVVASTVTRKLSMLFESMLFCVGALLNGFAQAVWMLIVGRLLLGFGIGFVNQMLENMEDVITIIFEACKVHCPKRFTL